MIAIDDKIISTDLLTTRFLCDLSACKGACCVEGDSGAPLESDEIELLDSEFEHFRPYLKEAGARAVERQGVAVIDADGDYTTPLIDGAECAYSIEDNGLTLCAIERAWIDGKSAFRKPISCHLYPIRLARFSNGSIGLNYHRWGICRSAIELGGREGVPLYRALREPIERRFGKDFFLQLEEAAKLLEEQQNQR